MTRLTRLAAVAVVTCVGLVGLTGCSASETDYCSQLESTEQAFDALAGTDVLAEGTDTLSERYDVFVAELESLLDAAGTEFADEADAVQQSVDQVGEVVQSAADLNLGTAAEQLGPALSGLASSTEALFTSVADACG